MTSPVTPPSATSITRSTAEVNALACVMVGMSSTMIAVIGATENRGLIAAMKVSGVTASARTASSAISLPCGISTPMAPP